MGLPFTQAYPGVISRAGFWSNIFNYDPLYASDDVSSMSAYIAGGLGILRRGTVLFGPAPGLPITNTTMLTTAAGGTARCILADDIDTTGGPVIGIVYTAGSFLATAMTFSSQGAALDVAQLWQFSAFVLTVLQRSGRLVPLRSFPTTGGPLPAQYTLEDAKKATKQEVEAIKAAMNAFRPGMESVPIAGMGAHGGMADPAWAVAAFGEREPTPLEKAREDAAEKTQEMTDKQEKDRRELMDKQQKELSELVQKQHKEREDLAKQQQDAIGKEQQQESARQQQMRPTVPGTAPVPPGAQAAVPPKEPPPPSHPTKK